MRLSQSKGMDDAHTDLNVAKEVAKAFGGIAELTGALEGCPFSTVYSWTKTGRIPAWRRSSIIAAAARKEVTLPTAFVASAA